MSALVGAIAFLWLGMVLALSFLEAPLKFRAPGITVQLGLGIGRLVFAAFNRVEIVLLLGISAALVIAPRPVTAVWADIVLAALLVTQLIAVKPTLSRRSDHVLSGERSKRSRAHVTYIVLECFKVLILLVLGTSALVAPRS
ncbi:MAG TPA: hypothetical protein VL595_28560 [Pseudonocardia sp.]|jgi:hypothetical protein|nr:hypothetical protein [Pseudonocardia sp.]